MVEVEVAKSGGRAVRLGPREVSHLYWFTLRSHLSRVTWSTSRESIRLPGRSCMAARRPLY
jgi:hypothetical protein